MTQIIQILHNKWSFKIYVKATITQNSPTIILLAEEFPQNHNSKFPYKIKAIYYVDNPEQFIKGQPQFIVNTNEKLLVLQHNFSNLEEELMGAINLMKYEFKAIAYRGLIIL